MTAFKLAARNSTSKANNRDRNRRRRFLDSVNEAVESAAISRGCAAWLLRLSKRSDDFAKNVWGGLEKMAKELRCSRRTLQRWRLEAERAGLIEVIRGTPERDLSGKWFRRMTNVYRLIVPKARPRRRSAQKRSSDLCDSTDTTNSILTNALRTLRADSRELSKKDDPEPFSSMPIGGFAAMKQLIASK